jgi:hypothetical protein
MFRRREEPGYEYFSWLARPQRRRAEGVQENLRREIRLLEDHIANLQVDPNHTYNMNARRQTEVENLELGANTSFHETSDVEKEQIRRELRAAVEKIERLQTELQTFRNFLIDETGDREHERTYMLRRIDQLQNREARIHEVLTQQNLSDDSSNEAEPEGHDDESDTTDEGDTAEHASRYRNTRREVAESSCNPYCESQGTAEERSEEVGTRTSSWLAGAAARSDNYETTMCDGGAAYSTAVPPPASMSDGSTDGQAGKCPICLCEFVTQEVGTPEACKHTFCADCLQEWLKNTNTCPIDRQVCDIILVRRCQGGEVRRVRVEPPRQQEEDDNDNIDYISHCAVCGDTDRFSELIYCHRCGQGYHMECLYPPRGEWFCRECSLPSLADGESEEEEFY